jgi:hypothetical protein
VLAGFTAEDCGGGSEDMLHSPIDALVRHTLSMLKKFSMATLPISMDRNRRDSGTSTKEYCRPDFLVWLNGCLMFLGEEKADSGAKEDLTAKLREIDPVFFGDIQFMTCYAVDGTKIRFYAFDGSYEAQKQHCPFIPLTPDST